jgi:hypothetical protein
MYARVVRWEGAEAQAMRDSAARIDAEDKPPEGIPDNSRFLMLLDPDNGRGLAIGLFASEEDRRTADAVLSAMDPPGDGMGKRVSVEMYELAVEKP